MWLEATLLLNARHHANEPSSTSGLLYLAGLLTSDARWRRMLDRVNVVLIPGENVDGMALYDTLQDEHPTWMHHAARYNAAGLEFVAAIGIPIRGIPRHWCYPRSGGTGRQISSVMIMASRPMPGYSRSPAAAIRGSQPSSFRRRWCMALCPCP